jgi:hypothetical protein
LFEVALCVFLYLTVLFIEFSPAALEWLGQRTVRNLVVRLTLVLTIFGVILSTLHQSSLGALVSDRPLQAASALVFQLPAGLLFRFEHLRGHVHGDLRKHPGPSVHVR